MTRKNGNRSLAEIKALLEEESDFLCPMVRAVIQEFLEAEMAEAVGPEKGERIEGRLSYRSGNLHPHLGDPSRQARTEGSAGSQRTVFHRDSSAISAAKVLVAALTQMYIQGVSTRKVQAISEEPLRTQFWRKRDQ